MKKKEKIQFVLNKTNFSNYKQNSLEQFIKDNIENINFCQNAYNYKNLEKYFEENTLNIDDIYFTSTEINVSLRQAFSSFIQLDKNKDIIINEFIKSELISDRKLDKKIINDKLQKIANDLGYLSSSIADFYNTYILDKYLTTLNTNKNYLKEILKTIENINKYQISKLSINEQNYIKNNLKQSLSDFLYLTFSNGFSKNIVISNTGVTNANEGDATQFLFIFRAMFAGFNCSNVDLRSSRYDAVIDIDGKILRVQVKGISNNSISFKNRDRGGEGINPENHRNKGKLISSKEIDLYVAVQKHTGICYIIPATKIDDLIKQIQNEGKKTYSYSISKLQYYKENWNIIYEVANYK